MDNGIHFISGLPRSGSTLLSAVLGQNPRFHTSIITPMGGFFRNLSHEMSQGSETSVFIDAERRKSVLKGAFDNYYYREHPQKVVFDTHRFWSTKIAGLGMLFPQSKVICCVRHVPWIVDSLERQHHRNGLEPSRIYNFDPAGTVYSRFETIRSGTGLVGFAWNGTREAFYGDNADRLMLLTYETLVSDPVRAVRAVYDFIGEPHFEHDYDHLEFDSEDFDQRLGSPGLHRVRPKLEAPARSTILPPDIWALVEKDSFWMAPNANPRGVRVV